MLDNYIAVRELVGGHAISEEGFHAQSGGCAWLKLRFAAKISVVNVTFLQVNAAPASW